MGHNQHPSDVEAGAVQQQQSIVVVTQDGRRFKMVMRGALENLSVEKIKRYLAKSTGIEPAQQVLTHGDRLLADDMVGGDFGLTADDVLHMRGTTGGASAASYQAPSAAGHGHQAGPSTSSYEQSRPVGPSHRPQPTALHQPAHDHSYGDHHHQQQQQSSSAGASGLRRDTVGRERQEREAAATRRTVASPDRHQHHHDAHAAPFGSQTTPPAGTRYTAGHSSYDAHNASGGATSRGGAGLSSSGYPAPPNPSGLNPSNLDPEHPVVTKLNALEAENRSLRQEIERLRKDDAQRSFLQPGPQLTVVANANANLDELSRELGVHLSFDDNLSCVVGFDASNTLIVTVDPPTERLYMYSTLTTTIPDDPVARLRLYESALEWSLLGRDMAGGGVGVCTRSGILMMSTSVDLKHSNTTALKDTAPVFVECLVRWRNAVSAVGPPPGVHQHH